MGTPIAGWYPDPADATRERFYDPTAGWSDETRAGIAGITPFTTPPDAGVGGPGGGNGGQAGLLTGRRRMLAVASMAAVAVLIIGFVLIGGRSPEGDDTALRPAPTTTTSSPTTTASTVPSTTRPPTTTTAPDPVVVPEPAPVPTTEPPPVPEPAPVPPTVPPVPVVPAGVTCVNGVDAVPCTGVHRGYQYTLPGNTIAVCVDFLVAHSSATIGPDGRPVAANLSSVLGFLRGDQIICTVNLLEPVTTPFLTA